MRPVLRFLAFACAILAALGSGGTANASKLIARNASNARLAVNAKGTALITYRRRGRVTHLLAWGAVNARPRPAGARVPQVKFRLDYSGRWKHHRLLWKHFRNRCGRYDADG